jgi:L-arabinonolactonase
VKRGRATCAVPAGNELGEGLVWDARTRALYWTDIRAARLWCWTPETGATRTWALPEPLACFALCEDDRWLLLGLASRLAFFDRVDGRVVPICAIEPGLPTRVNDGACDREGRFVFGTKHEPADGGAPQPVGAFYRLDADLSLHRLDLGDIAIANGTAFSPDGRTLYFCDSPTRTLRHCDYTRAGDAINVREFARLDTATGEPDGSTVDAKGFVWNAQWDAGRVVRYAPDGTLDTVIEVPVRRPTRPALGGADLRTLYVTSAGTADTPDFRTDQDGHVFAVPVDVPGLPEPRFRGAPP